MKVLVPLLKITLSLTLIAIVLRVFDIRGVTTHFAKVDAATLVLVTVIALSISLLHTLRWLAIIKANGSRLAFRIALQVVLIGHFFNQILPSSVGGDAARIWCAYRGGLGFAAAANTVLIDRVLSLFSLLLLTAAGLPWLFEIVTDPVARSALATLIVFGLSGYWVFLALRRLPQLTVRWRLAQALLDLAALGRKALSSAHCALPVIMLSATSFIGFAVIVFCLARAMGLEVTLRDCLLLVPPVILVSAVPVSIAGWGVREGAMIVAFGYVNVPPGAAFAVSVLFGLTLALASLPGSLLWWRSVYSVRNKAVNPKSPPATETNPGS